MRVATFTDWTSVFSVSGENNNTLDRSQFGWEAVPQVGSENGERTRPVDVFETNSLCEAADRKCCRPDNEDTGMQSRTRYGGAKPCYECQHLEINTSTYGQPVQVANYRRDVVELSGLGEESRCCILNGLQFCDQTTRATGKEAVAVVQFTADECTDQCLRRVNE